jgi:hypothetical protein
MAKKKAPIVDTQLVRVSTRDSINCKLTDQEIAERAIESCKVSTELEAAEMEFAAIKTSWKKQIEEIERKFNDLRRCVQSGEELREVDCQRVFDIARGITWIEFESKKYQERSAAPKELELLQQGSLEDHFGSSDEDDDLGF